VGAGALEGAATAALGFFGSSALVSGASGSDSSGFATGCVAGLAIFAGLLRGTSNFFCGAPAAANASFGFFAMATRMKSIHIGNAARAPVSFSPSV